MGCGLHCRGVHKKTGVEGGQTVRCPAVDEDYNVAGARRAIGFRLPIQDRFARSQSHGLASAVIAQ
jgi:hypothetical protein